MRAALRSMIVAEARSLGGEVGVRELNLIAQDLTAYGRDFRPQSSLAALLPMLAGIDGIRWIRLLYCYPNFVTRRIAGDHRRTATSG